MMQDASCCGIILLIGQNGNKFAVLPFSFWGEMNVAIDRFGRVLIPKQIREQLGLNPGTKLRLEPTEEGLSLLPVRKHDLFSDRDGVLVFTGGLAGDSQGAVDEIRTARMRKVAGLRVW